LAVLLPVDPDRRDLRLDRAGDVQGRLLRARRAHGVRRAERAPMIRPCFPVVAPVHCFRRGTLPCAQRTRSQPGQPGEQFASVHGPSPPSLRRPMLVRRVCDYVPVRLAGATEGFETAPVWPAVEKATILNAIVGGCRTGASMAGPGLKQRSGVAVDAARVD